MRTTLKILMIGPAWVGDMVMAQALFKLLKAQHPEAVLDMLAPPWSRPLLARMPEVHAALDAPFAHGELNLRGRYQLARQLRANAYDWAIVLPNSFKSALIPFWAKIPRRTGWLGEFRFGLLNEIHDLDAKKWPLMVQRFMALALPVGAAPVEKILRPELVVSSESVQTALKRYQLSLAQPVVALCPGAEFGPSKRWPSTYYAEIANASLKRGEQVWIFGSPRDQEVAAEIQAQTHHACVDLTGRTTLAEAVDLLAQARIVVSNDSGLMHIAAALQRPLVAIYGSSSPRFTPPLADRVSIVRLGLECSPCFKRVCPLGHFKCMLDLLPARVLTAMDEVAGA